MYPTQVFCLHLEEKTSCTKMCQSDLILTLLSETKYACTLQTNTDFLLQFYKDVSFIIHYCENLCKIYPFKIFDN